MHEQLQGKRAFHSIDSVNVIKKVESYFNLFYSANALNIGYTQTSKSLAAFQLIYPAFGTQLIDFPSASIHCHQVSYDVTHWLIFHCD
ncbi:hypothetical protein B4W69_08305 [Staphylococcus delphini]|nr:hypothetical protein B4W69_08305 [Staphylococcus delphini]